MVIKNAQSMRTARLRARMARKRGFNANIFKTKDNIRVSITRRK